MKLSAIETKYAGVLFRSRLEARWAVFFDALGIEWEYEPEAFRLKDGSGYLPDFRLPTFAGSIWVEVKPRLPDPAENDLQFSKAARFAAEGGESVWLCDGEPDHRATRLIRPANPEWGETESFGGTCVDVDRVLPLHGSAEGQNRFFTGADDCDHEEMDTNTVYATAVAAVRAHRFWNPKPAGGAP